jgi:hypothetical protein
MVYHNGRVHLLLNTIQVKWKREVYVDIQYRMRLCRGLTEVGTRSASGKLYAALGRGAVLHTGYVSPGTTLSLVLEVSFGVPFHYTSWYSGRELQKLTSNINEATG